MPFPLFYVADVLEIAVGFAHHFAVGEGIGVLCQDLMKIIELVLIDHADQHGFFCAGVGANCVQLGNAVVEGLGDLRDQGLFVVGDHRKFVGGFGTLEQLVAHKRGDKAVKNTQRHGLIIQRLLGIHEQGSDGHNGVENKGDDKEIGVGLDLVDIAGDDIRAAGGGVVAEANALHKTADHTAEDHRVDRVVALGVVLNVGQVGFLQKQEDAGIDQGKDQGLDCEFPVHQEKCQYGQGNIDQ